MGVLILGAIDVVLIPEVIRGGKAEQRASAVVTNLLCFPRRG